MYLIVVFACLTANPATCTRHPIGVVPDQTSAGCHRNSRMRAEAWDRADAGRTLRGWTCVAVDGSAG